MSAPVTTAQTPSAFGALSREQLFRETTADRLRRWGLGIAYALRPNRIGGVPAVLARTGADLLRGGRTIPQVSDALDGADGLCGIARRLDPDTLVEAYARGLYPFSHVGPVKWWAPRERMVLFYPEAHIAKRLRRQIRNDGYRVTFDRNFAAVIRACAQRRSGKVPLTWITPTVMQAFAAAFEAGLVHSFEVWNGAGELVGGGYGIAFGRMFSTESQFSFEPNTSKIGFTVLNCHLARWGFILNDGKRYTPTIDGMGFRAIPREEYTGLCERQGREPALKPGRWSVETDLRTVADWQPGQAG
jgi:leucyl/phenylalanyl-tRNA--protein transferase